MANWQARMLSVLRIITGLLFMQHGLSKLFGFPSGAMHPHFLTLLWFAGILETVGSALVVLGLFTRPAAFLLSGEMAIAYFKVHEPRSFYPILNGGELAIMFCFVFLYLAIAGGGAWGLDRMHRGRRSRG